MKSVAVIEHLDVVNNIYPSLCSGRAAFLMSAFGFHGMKETFINSVIPIIAPTTHAANHTILFPALSRMQNCTTEAQLIVVSCLIINII
jgi:hypothetical protein